MSIVLKKDIYNMTKITNPAFIDTEHLVSQQCELSTQDWCHSQVLTPKFQKTEEKLFWVLQNQ